MANYDQPIIIKKVKKAKHAHHGGAWKIAYADFVTAMMAFFLMLWLISMTTPEQKEGLANYFAPPNISQSNSGAGGIMGGTALDIEGQQMAGSSPQPTKDVSLSPEGGEVGAQGAILGNRTAEEGGEIKASETAPEDLKSTYDQNFHAAAASIRQAWQAMPDVAQIADNLLIEETKDGLNIQIVDQQGSRMFPEGSKYPVEAARKAIAALAPILAQLSNRITISGHTAAGAKYDNARYGPWELSSDRANAVRAILGEFGLKDDLVSSVIGRSTADPFFPNDPYLASNERVKITVLYEAPPVPAELSP